MFDQPDAELSDAAAFLASFAVGASFLVVQGRLLVQLFVSLFCRGGLWLLL